MMCQELACALRIQSLRWRTALRLQRQAAATAWITGSRERKSAELIQSVVISLPMFPRSHATGKHPV